MPAPYTHTAGELAALEASTGLQLLGYLATDAPRTLVPILGRVELGEQQRRRLVAQLNGRPQVEPAPVEQGRRAG